MARFSPATWYEFSGGPISGTLQVPELIRFVDPPPPVVAIAEAGRHAVEVVAARSLGGLAVDALLSRRMVTGSGEAVERRLSIFLPRVNVDRSGAPQPFRTVGVMVARRTTRAGPEALLGQIDDFEVIDISGTAGVRHAR